VTTHEQREDQEVDRQAEEVALLHVREAAPVAGEVAVVEHRPGEVGHDQGDRGEHDRDDGPSGDADLGQVEVDVLPARGVHQVAGEQEHHHVHRGATEVDELADRLHALPEHERLGDPHQHERDPAQQRQPGEAVVVDVGVRGQARPQLERDDDQRVRRQVGLDAVPGHRDQAADDGRDVGAHDAEGHPGDHRVGHAGGLAGPRHQVAQEVDDRDADQQRDQHLPGGQPEREQAAGGDVAADAVHVGHPESEEVVRRPGLLLQRRQVLVGQPIVVAGLDVAGAGGAMAGRSGVVQ
jgi:hypothetical protein